MAIVPSQYPGQIWNGDSPSPWRENREGFRAPDPHDWDQVVAEVIATQERLNEVAAAGGGSSFASQMRVYFDGNQVIPFGSIVKLTWNNIQYDNNNEWDAANNQWVCKEAGIYHFGAAVNFPNYYNGAWAIIAKNGSDSLVKTGLKPADGSTDIVTFTDAKMEIGDYVDVRVVHIKMPSIELWGGDSCQFFEVHRVG
jgi:hypothetical protein